jgi:GTP cyclohydrolase II
MESGMTTFEAFKTLGIPQDAREYGVAVAILRAFRVANIVLLTNNPAKVEAVQRGGFMSVRREPSIMRTSRPELAAYLKSKAIQLGHWM